MKKKMCILLVGIVIVVVSFGSALIEAHGMPEHFAWPYDIMPGRESNFGITWEFIGLEDKLITSLAATETHLFAATRYDGVFRKDLTDPSSSWDYLGFADLSWFLKVYVHPAAPQTIFVGLELAAEPMNETGEPHSLYRSDDSGHTWYPSDNGIQFNVTEQPLTGPPGPVPYRLPVYSITSEADNPEVLYVTSILHVFKSIDSGHSWTMIWGDPEYFPLAVGTHVITVDPSDPQRLWIGGEGGTFQPFICKTTDGGETWDCVTPWMGGDNACYAIQVHPQDSDIVYAGMEGAIMKTTDGGNNWTAALSTPWFSDMPSYFQGLVLDLDHPNRLFAGGTPPGGLPLLIWRTTDDGDQWTYSIEQEGENLYALIFDCIDHNILYAGTYGSGVWRYEITHDAASVT